MSQVARGTNELLRGVGIHSRSLDNLGHPYSHILGETFSTVAPIRYGDYVAKIGIVPSSDNLKQLTGGIMRSRRLAYEEAQKFRAERNLRATLSLVRSKKYRPEHDFLAC